MTTEITSKQQIYNLIKTYAIRHRQGQPFTVEEISSMIPSYNRIQLKWDLEDLVISKVLGKRGEHGYYGIDLRTLKEKIVSLFGNDTVSYSSAEIERYFKVRPQDVKDAIAELVKEDVLEQHPFLGMNYWLKLDTE